MGTDMQNFDLYDLGGRTAADMHEGPRPIEPAIRRVVEEHDSLALDDEGDRETLIAAMTAALTPLTKE